MSSIMARLARGLRKSVKSALIVAGVLFVLQVLIGLLGVPPCITKWMRAESRVLDVSPDVIVVLGGGGIPSETGLMRTYYGAALAGTFPEASVVVALPTDSDPELSSVGRMKRELIMRGVAPERILMEYQGKNTYQQACEVYQLLGDTARDTAILVVTSPTHTRRALLCFHRAGFSAVGSSHVAEVFAETDMDAGFETSDYLGLGTGVRYGFWSTLQYEVRLVREGLALLFYRMKGWV